MDDSARRWISIVAAAAAIVVFALIVAVAGAGLYAARHITRRSVSMEQADATFARLRARFRFDRPLIEVTDTGEVLAHPNDGPGGTVHSIHVVAFNPAGGRLIELDAPVWLLGLAPSRDFPLSDSSEFGTGGTHLSLDEIERHGPGLILDHRRVNGAEALVWAE